MEGNLKVSAKKQILFIVLDNFYITSYIPSKNIKSYILKIPIPQEFFNIFFDKVSFISDFIKLSSSEVDITDPYIEIYSSISAYKKYFLKITQSVYIINSQFLSNVAIYFASKFNASKCYVMYLSRDSIFVSSGTGEYVLNKNFDDLYTEFFKRKNFDELILSLSKIKKFNIYNAIAKFPYTGREYFAMPIVAMLMKSLLSDFQIETNGELPIIVLTGDFVQFFSDVNESIFSLLYGLSSFGFASLYIDKSNSFPLLSAISSEEFFNENLVHAADIFKISFEKGFRDKEYVQVKIVDDSSIRNVKLEKGNILNIPVTSPAHIIIKLPPHALIGSKRNDVEFIAKGDIVVDAKDVASDNNFINKWTENLEPLSF